jgi:hypothetical protein
MLAQLHDEEDSSWSWLGRAATARPSRRLQAVASNTMRCIPTTVRPWAATRLRPVAALPYWTPRPIGSEPEAGPLDFEQVCRLRGSSGVVDRQSAVRVAPTTALLQPTSAGPFNQQRRPDC